MEIVKQNEIINPASVLNDLQLTATLPHEMVNAQQQLITWVDSKLILLRVETKELELATAHAKKMKWKYSVLHNQHSRSIKRVSYYEKIKSALIEGYYIVPNFPIQMFAIRTNKQRPLRVFSTRRFDNRTQEAMELPETIGEYKNPVAIQYEITQNLSEGKTLTQYWNEKWDDIDFPITMAKPEIMEATSHAMGLKVFDRIGIMPSIKRKEDPVIIGQIISKTNAYSEKIVSFMIAWHLNTNVL